MSGGRRHRPRFGCSLLTNQSAARIAAGRGVQYRFIDFKLLADAKLAGHRAGKFLAERFLQDTRSIKRPTYLQRQQCRGDSRRSQWLRLQRLEGQPSNQLVPRRPAARGRQAGANHGDRIASLDGIDQSNRRSRQPRRRHNYSTLTEPRLRLNHYFRRRQFDHLLFLHCCWCAKTGRNARDQAGKEARTLVSMWPPREHGGRTATTRSAWGSGSSLQWGRRVNTAEGSAHDVARITQSVWLQWGRRVNTAEGVNDVLTPVVTPSRFNGAAALTRRMGVAESEVRLAPLQLQWGRRVNTAEGISRASLATSL